MDPLLKPFKLKNVNLRNRIISTSHAAGLGELGMPADRYQRYHEEKVRGGIAMTMFGGSSNISIDSPSIMPQLNIGIDEIIPHLKVFSNSIHSLGGAIMCQITHLGRRGEFNKGAILPTIAPSVVRETLHRSIPKEMDKTDIKRVVADFAAAAKRCADGGLDGIECLGSSHLIGQFLSPTSNFRADEYGGTLINRCRFGLEVFEAIRKAVGDDFVISFRFVVDESWEEGLNFEESLAIASVFKASGLIDCFNALYGRMDTLLTLASENMPGMASPVAPWLSKAGKFKDKIDMPVFHAARISDVATARYAIQEGLIDLVGMTRAHIADPYIVEKISKKMEETIRPCVGATHCMSPDRPTCLHNPATGNESILRQVIEKSRMKRRVVVVGAGPAGLEAARICSERGHSVTVFEAASKAGGQVRLAAEASWRREIIGIVDWRLAECERLNVDFRFNAYASREDILRLEPHLVVIATGGIPNIDWVPGAEHLTSPWDVITGSIPPAEQVLVVDGTGRHVALTAAEFCSKAGALIEFVTIDETLAAEQTYSERVHWRKWASETELSITFEHALQKIEKQGNTLKVSLRSDLTDRIWEVECQQVIFDYGTIPADALYFELRNESVNNGITELHALANGLSQPRSQNGFSLHRIGDAVSSRNIHTAILDAMRLCQSF